jgi:hypothetical protein
MKALWLLLHLLFQLLLLEGNGDPPDDDTDDDLEDDTGDDDEPTRDPEARIKSLREANNRLANKIKKKDEEIAELRKGSGGDQESALVEISFLREVLSRETPIDHETALDLALAKGYFDALKVEDGEVSGMPEAIDSLVSRYPWLESDTDADDEDTTTGKPSVRPVNRSRQRGTESRAGLERRFPALGRRRRSARR